MLALVPVHAQRGPTVTLDVTSDQLHLSLGFYENYYFGARLGIIADFLQQLVEFELLFVFLTHVDNLKNVMVSRQLHRPDINSHEVIHEIRRQLPHFLWPRRRPHQRLPVRPDLLNNLSDLRLETHVQHPIGFVQNQIGAPGKVCSSLLKEINQPARSGDANLHALFQIPFLGIFWSSAEDAGVARVGGPAEIGGHLLNLLSQLSGGGQDERDGAIAGTETRLVIDVHDGREDVG